MGEMFLSAGDALDREKDAEIARLRGVFEAVEQLRRENKRLTEKNVSLLKENGKYLRESCEHIKENANLRQQNEKLQATIGKLSQHLQNIVRMTSSELKTAAAKYALSESDTAESEGS